MRNTQNHLNVLQSYLISCEPTEYVQVIVAHMRVKERYFKQSWTVIHQLNSPRNLSRNTAIEYRSARLLTFN